MPGRIYFLKFECRIALRKRELGGDEAGDEDEVGDPRPEVFAAGFLICLLASLRLAGAPQASN